MTPILEVVHADPGILGGTPDEFLRQFPSVKREQAIAAIELARDTVIARARTA
jgi:uncharacterized protein (DUF433 family)